MKAMRRTWVIPFNREGEVHEGARVRARTSVYDAESSQARNSPRNRRLLAARSWYRGCMSEHPGTRPNGREIAAGIAIAVSAALAGSAGVFLFDLHPAVMSFAMIVGIALGTLLARHMAGKRLAAASSV